MNNNLRSYAHVRNRISSLERVQSDIDRSIKNIVPPAAYTQPLGPPRPSCDISGPADLLIKNARVLDASSARRGPVSIAVKNKCIAYVGDDIAGLADSGTETVDAAGNTVIPGLCDGHVHLMVGSEHYRGCDVEDVRDSGTLQRKVKSFVQRHPEYDVFYVYGLHYMNAPLIPPTHARRMLDDIIADKPLFVYAHDLHTGWANTRALEVAELMHRMPPYPKLIRELELEGSIDLDTDGFPIGELREPPVYFIVEEALRRRFPFTREQKKSFLEEACRHLTSFGLTSVHNMGLSLPEEDIECLMLLLELEEEGRLPLRVHSSCSIVPDEMMLEDVLRAAQVRNSIELARQGRKTLPELHSDLFEIMKTALLMREGEKRIQSLDPLSLLSHFTRTFSHIITASHLEEHYQRGKQLSEKWADRLADQVGLVHCKAVKLFMDGVVEKDTAFRLDHHSLPGIPAFSPQELDLVVQLADRLGLQAAAHCIGNGSVNVMLNSIELARQLNAAIDRERGGRVRHRIEHIEMCSAFDIPRFRRLDVIASMQPLHERPPVTLWHEKVPEIEWPTAFAWKSLIESGANLVFGSDWPIVSCNCFEGIQRAVGRKPWKPGMTDQHLSLEEALAAFSSHAAVAEYNEQIKGKISEGMLADLVILTDSLENYRGDYGNIGIAHTISNGKIVHTA
ncbi:MAG: amidohydrolase [Peptococcaceae bacterium]|jgi:predicted amidohydrolase YtcJ|nr:amidohydrolase [Peptococcaceae bacterium]